MRMAIAALLLVASCTSDSTEPDPTPTKIGEVAVADCGEPPLSPGFAASFNGGTATMTTADYQAMTAWKESMVVWRDCVVSHP